MNNYDDCLHNNTKLSNVTSATCANDGYTGDIYCVDCQVVIVVGEGISALGHEYENGYCTVCGKVEGLLYTVCNYNEIAITGYEGSPTELIIPSLIDGCNVTQISSEAFKGCTSLSRITLPDTMYYIGYSAFSECTSLSQINLPGSLSSIDSSAFNGCTSLETITIPDGVIGISSNLFNGCSNLKTVVFNGDVKYISGAVFRNCTNLINIIIPDTVTSIGEYAFENCKNLTSITLNGVVSIDWAAFRNCKNLQEVVFSENLSYIGGNYMYGGAFENCTSLKSISLPANLQTIEEYAFKGCTNLLSVTIADNSKLIYVGDHAFSDTVWVENDFNYTDGFLMLNNCLIKVRNNYTGICYLPTGLTYIPEGTFDDCDRITIVVVPEGVTEIEYQAFYGARKLVALYLPTTLEEIDYWNFDSTYDLFHVLYAGTEEDWSSISVGSSGNSCLINATKHYGISDEVISASVTLEPSCTAYGDAIYACSVCNSQKEASLSKNDHSGEFVYTVLPTCTSSGYDTHLCDTCGQNYNTNWIDSLGHNGTLIENAQPTCTSGDYDMYFCSRCEKTYSGNWTEKLGHNSSVIETLETCTQGNITKNYCSRCNENVYESDGNTGEHSFVDGVCTVCNTTNCWEYYFSSWDNGICIEGYSGDAKNIVIPEILEGIPVVSIGYEAFHNNDLIETVCIPDTVKYIGSAAFRDCDNLNSVNIPSNVTSLGDYEFAYCDNLVSVEFTADSKLTNLSTGTFSGCDALKNIALPDGITRIYASFQECSGLEYIKLPENLKEIGYGTFSGCDRLTDVFIPLSVTKIDENAFGSCYNLWHILYAGDEDAWNNITITSSSNYYFTNATRHFNADGDEIAFASHVDPTCTERGYDVYKCSICESTNNRNYQDSLGHSKEVINVIAPTCLEQGYTECACSVCGETYISDYVSALGHSEETTNVIASTCLENGYTEYSCTVCGENYISNYTNPLGHSFDNDVCLNCGKAKEDCIESSHNYENNCDETWIISKPNADYITITFSSATETERGWDYIYIYDMDDNLIGQYSGTELASQTITVKGNIVKIRLTSDSSVNKYGFAVSDICSYIKFSVNDVEVAMPENTIDSTAELRVDEIDINNIVAVLPEEFDVTTVNVYDIYFEKDEQRVQPNGAVTVYIPVPSDMDGEKCKVFHIDESGNATDMNAVYENGYMVFTTEHFSYYALVDEQVGFVYGDANGDTVIDGRDVVRLKNYLANYDYDTETSTVEIFDGADANGDGIIDGRDVIRLKNYLANYDYDTDSSTVVLGPQN